MVLAWALLFHSMLYAVIHNCEARLVQPQTLCSHGAAREAMDQRSREDFHKMVGLSLCSEEHGAAHESMY